MADNTPNVPGGAMPPKPTEAAKVQPKKETVRITLPPKPTAAPTVKLPSVAPSASAPPPPSAPTPPPPGSGSPALAQRPASAPATAAPGSTAKGPATSARPGAMRPAPAPVRSSGLDSFLAIAAGVFSLAAAGIIYFLFTLANTEY